MKVLVSGEVMGLLEAYKEETRGDVVAASNLVLAHVTLHGQAGRLNAGESYTVQQAAEVLGVSDKTVYGLCSASKLEHHRVGTGRGTIRISRQSLDRYREDSEQKARNSGAAPSPFDRFAREYAERKRSRPARRGQQP